jgi:drug/metabolite transporter (DMT)-like permease
MKQALKSWRTALGAVCGFLLAAPVFVADLTAWSNHQPVNWRSLLISLAMAALAVGLASAKDAAVHSTLPEIQASTAKEAAKEEV